MNGLVDVLTRYLALCDVPASAEGDLGELFTEDAVWEGGGSAYAEKFGRTEGRKAIVGMLSGYLPPNPYFRTNVHLLFPGTVEAGDAVARGRWQMQQLSQYAAGGAQLLVARLDVTFRLDADRPRIAAFRTERLFSAALLCGAALPEER